MVKFFPDILEKFGFLRADRITGEIKTLDGSSVVTSKTSGVTGVVELSAGGVPITVGGTSSLPNVVNFDPKNYLKSRIAINKARAQLAHAKLLCIGDSETFGIGGNGTPGGKTSAFSYPVRLAEILTAQGTPCVKNGWLGAGVMANDYGNLWGNNDISTGTGWATSFPSLGGMLIGSSSPTGPTTDLAFTPTDAVDSFDVYYVNGGWSSYFGSFNMRINAGVNTQVDTWNGTGGIAKVTITAALGVNTLNLNWTLGGGGNIFILGAIGYNSARKAVQVFNAGWSTSTSNDVANSNDLYSSEPSIRTFAPDLTIISLGVNDWLTGSVSIATYKVNLQKIYAAAAASGDVIFLSPNPSNETNTAAAVQKAYSDAMKEVALANNCAFFDMYSTLTPYADHLGLYVGDNIHPNGAGYASTAMSLARVISNI